MFGHDVVLAVQKTGYDIRDNPISKRSIIKVQQAFNTWYEESGLPYAHINKIVSYSVGRNYDN